MTDIADVAHRWSRRARSGEWARVLGDPESYVNEDDSYRKFKIITDRILAKSKQSSILDVGCGDAALWDILLRYVPLDHLYGIDVAEGMLEKAREKYPAGKFVLGDAAELKLADAPYFSSAVSRGVLVNHLGIDYFSKILEAVYSHLSTQGIFVFDFINKDWFLNGKPVPQKDLFSSESILEMVAKSPFKLDAMRNADGRDPVVILRK